MKIKEEIIQRIYGHDIQNDCEIKKGLSKLLKKNYNSICLYLRENRENGELTKFESLGFISTIFDLEIEEITEQ